jgi:hypothetical protein
MPGWGNLQRETLTRRRNSSLLDGSEQLLELGQECNEFIDRAQGNRRAQLRLVGHIGPDDRGAPACSSAACSLSAPVASTRQSTSPVVR